MHQPELLEPEHIPSRLRWGKLFALLPAWPEARERVAGRKPVNRLSLVKALVYQRLSGVRFLRDLRTRLLEQPPLLAAMGFDAYREPPSLERFSAFLGDCPHPALQALRVALVGELLQAGVIRGEHLGLDSCPVASWVRENNLKTSLRHRRWDKACPPAADPDARLGVRVHYPNPDEAQVAYFWGYRHHTLADLECELPLWEITEPNSVGEVSVALPLLQAACAQWKLPVRSVSGDAEYDVEKILSYVVDTLHAQPFMPHNPRNAQDAQGFRRDGQAVFCPANLPMHRHGRMTVKAITYVQYRCPFHEGPKPELLVCPSGHPKFTAQKGCNYLWRVTENLRDRIPYGTDQFREHYNRRTAIERVFSRLLTLTIQQPSVRGLNAVRNHCTLAHIAVLLVALAAHRFGHTNKIRFVRTYVPNSMRWLPEPKKCVL
jgi:hypothetical protein